MSRTLTVPGGVALPARLVQGDPRAAIARARERDEPLVVATSRPLADHRALGFGPATVETSVELPIRAPFTCPPPPGPVTTTSVAALAPVWEAVRAQRPGTLDLGALGWEPDDRVVAYGVEGAAVYRVEPPAGRSASPVTVRLLVAATREAQVGLWRHVLDLDLPPRTVVRAAGRPVDEPLPFLLANARDARTELGDGLWLHLADVPAALAGRTYAVAGRVVLDVNDDACPWNGGRFALEAAPDGAAACQPTSEAADLRLAASALASAYLGGHRLPTLARAGWVEELRPGTLTLAGAMFLATSEPWCPARELESEVEGAA
jgi:hypothetical protein